MLANKGDLEGAANANLKTLELLPNNAAAMRNLAIIRRDQGKLDEALRYFTEIAARPDICAYYMLEPGDMAFWHNFTNLHSRTAFSDSERRKRLLLRLWLDVPGGRPVVPNMRVRADSYRWIYEEAKRQKRELTGAK